MNYNPWVLSPIPHKEPLNDSKASELPQRKHHPVKGLGQRFSRTGKVQPDEPFSPLAEFFPIAQGDLGLSKEKVERVFRNPGVAAVEPGQISRLHLGHSNIGE